MYSVVKQNHLIHLFQNSPDRVMFSRVSGQCSHVLPVYGSSVIVAVVQNQFQLFPSLFSSEKCVSQFVFKYVSVKCKMCFFKDKSVFLV